MNYGREIEERRKREREKKKEKRKKGKVGEGRSTTFSLLDSYIIQKSHIVGKEEGWGI